VGAHISLVPHVNWVEAVWQRIAGEEQKWQCHDHFSGESIFAAPLTLN